MTTLFSDSFAGTPGSSISARTPDVGFGGRNWGSSSLSYSNTTPGIENTTTSTGSTAFAIYGDDTVSFGFGDDVTASFSVAGESAPTGGFGIYVYAGGRSFSAFLVFSSSVWSMYVADNIGGESSHVTIPNLPTAASGTFQTFTLHVTATNATLTAPGGATASLTQATVDGTGFNAVRINIGKDVYLSQLVVTDPSVTTGHGTFALTAPSPTLASGRAGGSISGTLVAPSPTLISSLGGFSTLAAPTPNLSVIGHDATGGRSATLAAPRPALAAFAGATGRLISPKSTLVSTATSTALGAASVVAPTPTLLASGTTSAVAGAKLKAPTMKLVGYFGAVATVSVAGNPTVAATGTTGSVGIARLTAPLFDLSVGATSQNHGSAILAAPIGRMATTGAAWLIAPGAQLTAIGTAVVTVTHEAYALNLKHLDADSPDELTRYTNYPFDKILRYENSYFGVNATGLYLLEGSTDFADPTPTKVPWAFKTGMTDFDMPNLKTVNWAYFGGRMAPAATVSIHFGDTGEQSYAYATPRGASAQNYRQPFGRGIKSRYYAFEAEGSGELSLDSMMFDIAKLARKV